MLTREGLVRSSNENKEEKGIELVMEIKATYESKMDF